MSQHIRTSGVGEYRASEVHSLIWRRSYGPDNTQRGIIFCHGVSENGYSHTNQGHNNDKLMALAAAGYPVMCADLSSSTYAGANWANSDHVSAIGAAFTFITTTGGAKTDKVGLYCTSMGVAGGLAWARANLSSVFAVAAGIPVLDMVDIHDNDKGGLAASINAAYGGSFPPGDITVRDPSQFGVSDLTGLPVKLWTASDDPIATSTLPSFGWDGKGAVLSRFDMGEVGHDASAIDAQQVVSFFDANGGRT